MKDILKIYRAENLWEYIACEKKFTGNDTEKDYFEAAKDFGLLCSLEAASKNRNDLSSPRPLDYDFVDTYNQIATKLLKYMESNQRISLIEIGNDIYAHGKFNNGIAAICYDNFWGILSNNAIDGTDIRNYIDTINRMKIVSNFCSHLNALKSIYNSDSVYLTFQPLEPIIEIKK